MVCSSKGTSASASGMVSMVSTATALRALRVTVAAGVVADVVADVDAAADADSDDGSTPWLFSFKIFMPVDLTFTVRSVPSVPPLTAMVLLASPMTTVHQPPFSFSATYPLSPVPFTSTKAPSNGASLVVDFMATLVWRKGGRALGDSG